MISNTKKIAAACWKPVRYLIPTTTAADDSSDHLLGSGEDTLVWSRDLERHFIGEFSYGVVQANEVIEDHSQVETGRKGVFVGVYDGHGGPEASRFVAENLFHHVMRISRDKRAMSEDVLRNAILATEIGFLTLVRRSYAIKPTVAAMGSCCLCGIIWDGTLYLANVGDSRAVVGSLGPSGKIIAEQLTKEHNASLEEVREELRSLHPDDSHIVVMKQGVWRVKGIIQVSRSIGDAYLKKPEFSLDPSFPRFHLPESIKRPVLSAEPSIFTRDLVPSDQFFIFASDGLWEHISNQQAVEIVYNNPRTGSAKRLIRKALKEAAKKGRMSYEELKQIEKGTRRYFHDDITVVVVFLDQSLLERKTSVPELSIRGFIDTAGPSKFSILQDMG
ncbi:hypothetical protein Droror1_Dr00016587 [Drosera rotundifolia]